jgi:endonuclease/exonuclease/phosphatase family metal-dependent hydrolase
MRAIKPISGLILALVLFSISASVVWPSVARRSFRVMTYNIHHGEGVDGKIDVQRIAQVIRRERADIVALQEVDRGVERTARRDLIAELAAMTKMNYAFGKNIDYQGGEYGNAVLTRFPIVKQHNHHYQMLRPGEQRGLLQVVVRVESRELLVLNTHIDFRPDDSERLMNVDEARQILAQYPSLPVVFCGDFNDTPGGRTHAKMKDAFVDLWERHGRGDGFTYPSTQPQKRIDYIFIKKTGSLVPIRAWVVQSEASDHLPVVAEVQYR